MWPLWFDLVCAIYLGAAARDYLTSGEYTWGILFLIGSVAGCWNVQCAVRRIK